jgi:Serine/threonine protein phosphatase
MDDSEETEPEEPDVLASKLTDGTFPPLSSTVSVQVAARSHRGGRPENGDHFLIVELGRYQQTIATNLPDGQVPVRFEEAGYGMIVADGLGKAGATASRLAITTLAHLVLHFGKWQLRIDPDTADDVINRARRFYRQVDQTVTETGQRTDRLVGDGRDADRGVQRRRHVVPGARRSFARVSVSRRRADAVDHDQTLRQRIADSGPGPFEAAANELDHVLTDVIGGHARPARIQVGQFELRGEDCVLLCTNGLTDVVDDKSAAAVLGMRRRSTSGAGRWWIWRSRAARRQRHCVLAKYDVPAYRSAGRPG